MDIGYAFRLATLLTRYYRKVWLDRFEIPPAADWQKGIRDARAKATSVIAIVTDDYLQSAYCLSEFEYFREREIAVTAVIARDFSTDEISNFTFSDWVDFRRWFDDPTYQNVENLMSQFPQSDSVPQTGERLDYLWQFIQEMELALSKMPTSWAVERNGGMPKAGDIRPRMLHAGLLHEWSLTAEKSGMAMPLADLPAWAESEAQFVIAGETGSGKTFLARLLALAQAHVALKDEQAALPIWFDMARWDENTRSIDNFVEANWPLLTYWNYWLETEPAVVFLDNWSDFCDAYGGYASEVTNWIDTSPSQRYVLLSNDPSGEDLALPIVRIDRISVQLAQKFAGGVLTLDQQNSFRQLLRQKEALILDSSLAYLSIGLELLTADRALAHSQWQQNPLRALVRLRGQRVPAGKYGLRAEAVLVGLEELAWSMMQQGRHRYVSRNAALEAVRDVRVIEYALEIGLIVEVGSLFRFESELLQWYLAVESLKRDGLIKHLARPTFDENSDRVPSKWDKLTLLLVDSLGEESRLRVIGQIADIDPFLAGMCLRRHPHIHQSYREKLIQNLVDLCAQNAAARGAFRSAIADYAEPLAVADALIAQMTRHSNKLQLWLWYEIGALPLELPLDFIERVSNVDRSGASSVADQLAPYSLSRSVACLVVLSQQEDPDLRRTAIWTLGELKYLPTAILLLDYLDKAERDDIDAVLLALMKFAYSEILLRVLRWSHDKPEHRAAVLSALAARKRRVTSCLLTLADAKRLTLEPEFYDFVVDIPERDMAIGLAMIAAEHVDLPESVEAAVQSASDAAALHQRVAGAIKHLPNREGFQRIIEDIVEVLRDPPEATVIAGSNIDALLYGKPVFDSLSAQTMPSATDGLPDELSTQLQHSDWKQRHRAVNQLMSYSADKSLPLLLQAAADIDKRVRLAAYEILAKFDGELTAQKSLVAALSDPDIEIVNAATQHLLDTALADQDVFVELLESSNPATVAAAIEILGVSRQRQAIDELNRLIHDTRVPAQGFPPIGQRARQAINRLEASIMTGDESQYNGVGYAAGGHDGFSNREKVLRTLQVLRDDDWGRTQKAAKFLRKFARHMRGRDRGEVRQLLCDAASDSNWTVRWAAVEALAVLHDREAIPALSARLQDSSWIVQVASVRALVELKAVELAGQFLPLLQSRHTQVREAATEALGEFKETDAVQQLGNLLKHDADDFVRLAALKSICQIGPENVRTWLELALSDGYLHVRLYAILALSPHMDDSDLPILRKLLEDGEAPSFEAESPRDIAIQVLRRLDSAESRALLDSIHAAEDRTGA